MQASEAAYALIKRFEGFSETPYLCPAGMRTIGYGHVIKPQATISARITVSQAEKLLEKDIQAFEKIVQAQVGIILNQSQFDALVSFVYNIGETAFMRSTMLKRIKQNNHAAAAKEFARWVYVKGQKMPGLIARRAAEAALYAS